MQFYIGVRAANPKKHIKKHTYHRTGTSWKHIAGRCTDTDDSYKQDVKLTIEALLSTRQTNFDRPAAPSPAHIQILRCLADNQGSRAMMTFVKDCEKGVHKRKKEQWNKLILEELALYESVLTEGRTDELKQCKYGLNC
jgi:hypothetical protein